MEMLWTAVDAGFCTLPFWRITGSISRQYNVQSDFCEL